MARVNVSRNSKGTRKSVINKRRKGFLALFFPWLRRFGIVMGVLFGVLWLGAWLVMSGSLGRGKDWVDNQVLLMTADMGFKVDNILVEGRVHSDPEMLLAIVNVEKGDPLFSFDPKEAQAMVAKIGWVDHAQVERRWPDTIYIGLSEREPLALWQDEKNIRLLDTKGQVIATDHLERFKDLLLVMGPDAPEHAAEMIASLQAEPIIAKQVDAARRLGERRWDLLLKDGITVKLPEKDMELALSRLAKAQEESGILQKDIENIDLREDGRLVVKTRPGAAEEYKASLKVDAKAGNSI
jgi:cell division protein FtsQ